MKDEILNLLNMKDIVDKYGIETKRNMCHCPFHKDKHPSMKIYEKSFYCFSCNSTGDLIEFVEQYFNLSFLEAMEKINIDFNLRLKTKGKIDRKKYLQLKQKHELKKQQELRNKKIINDKLIEASNRYRIYSNIVDNLKKETTRENWEEKVEVIAFLQEKLELLDWYMQDLLIKKAR